MSMMFRSPSVRADNAKFACLEELEPRLLLSALPIMHSNPGAPLALYLDFDGGTVFGTYRGPYDRDGNPTDYNATEITQITNCWKDVTAMFSMFDVDVTTEFPDVYHQTTAWLIVSPDTSGGASNTNVLPNLIARSTNNQNNATGRTTGITHEYGHNIGLNHQKTFDAAGTVIKDYRPALNNVGAIMGVDYAGAFAQWWLGHGVAADGLQDDIQVIVSKLLLHAPAGYTGDGFADDDYAGDLNAPTANATYLTGTTSWSAQGVIERMTDTDLFSFDWSGGHVTVGANNRYSAAYAKYMSSVGLDVRVFNSSGGLVGFNGATADDDTSYSVTMNLPAGRYYTAFSSFGNYADLGSYDVSIVSAANTGLPTPKTHAAGMNALMAVDASSNLTSQVKLRLDNPDPSSQSVIVERSTNGVNWSSIYTSSTYAASRTITNSVSPATKYFYRYGIRNSSGVYHYSSPLEVTTYSSTVSGLTITTLAAASKQVLDWADNYRDSGYAVKESVNGGAYVQIGTTGTNFNMFVRPQTAGNTYAYQVAGLAGNTGPIATGESVEAVGNEALVFNFADLLANDDDPDGDGVILIDVSDATFGTVVLDAGAQTVTYTPEALFTGSAWFNYRIADGLGHYDIATVNLTILSPNTPPTVDQPIDDVTADWVAEDTVIDLSGVFSGTTGSALTLTVSVNTDPGVVGTSIAGTDLTLSYTAFVSGSADITIRATDSGGLYVEDTFTVTVNAIADSTPPAIVEVTPAGIAANGILAPLDQIVVRFSEAVYSDDAVSAANYQLVRPGPDTQYDTADDIVSAITAVYDGVDEVTLTVTGGALPAGSYRLTIYGEAGHGIRDLGGLRLDGDGDSLEGGNAVMNFSVALVGDADRDGDIDNADIGQTAGSFTGAGGSTTKTWSDGDFDGDGDVDNADLGLVMGAFTGARAGGNDATSPAATLAPADAIAAEAAAMDAALDSYGLPATPLTASLGPDRTRACFDVLSSTVIRPAFRQPAALAPAAMPILGISGAEPWYSPPQVDLLTLPNLRTIPARSLGRLLTNPLQKAGNRQPD